MAGTARPATRSAQQRSGTGSGGEPGRGGRSKAAAASVRSARRWADPRPASPAPVTSSSVACPRHGRMHGERAGTTGNFVGSGVVGPRCYATDRQIAKHLRAAAVVHAQRRRRTGYVASAGGVNPHDRGAAHRGAGALRATAPRRPAIRTAATRPRTTGPRHGVSMAWGIAGRAGLTRRGIRGRTDRAEPRGVGAAAAGNAPGSARDGVAGGLGRAVSTRPPRNWRTYAAISSSLLAKPSTPIHQARLSSGRSPSRTGTSSRSSIRASSARGGQGRAAGRRGAAPRPIAIRRGCRRASRRPAVIRRCRWGPRTSTARSPSAG